MQTSLNSRNINGSFHQRFAFLIHPALIKFYLLSGFLAAVFVFQFWSHQEQQRLLAALDPQGQTMAGAGMALYKVDVNHATSDELERLPQIGPVLAQAILKRRNEKGPFRSAEALLDVKGIGPKRLAQITPYLLFHEKPINAETLIESD